MTLVHFDEAMIPVVHLMQFPLVISRCNITFSVFWLSQGSVATLIGWGGWVKFIPSRVPFIFRCDVKSALKFVIFSGSYRQKNRMWANAQRDGRPAKYRWRPLFNAAKFGWRPLLECRAVTLPRRETRWNLQGCPKLVNLSQTPVGRSSSYYQDMWRRYCCLTSFFPIVNTCLSCEDTAEQSSAMVPKWRFFASCIFSQPRAAHFRHAF